MRKLLLTASALVISAVAFAQGGNHGQGGCDGNYSSLAERVLKLEKKTDNFNLFLNYSTSFQMSEADGEWSSAFRAKQLRLEIKGSFGDHLTYRLRHRLNRSNAAMSAENFAKATDIMMVGWKFNDKWEIQGGKLCQYWGGFEFDENPMYIYQYSDMVDYMDNFLGGAALLWRPIPSQEFVLNVSNAYSGKFFDEYEEGGLGADWKKLQPANHPLSAVFNWNGSFAGGLIETRWGVGMYNQAKDYTAKMVFLGQKLNLPKFQVYFDYMGSWEGLDRLKIASGDLQRIFATTSLSGYTVVPVYETNVSYQSFVVKANWQFAPKWNLMLKGMYETAALPKTKDWGYNDYHFDEPVGIYRTSLGYIGSLEYYPEPDQDFRVFLAYIGRGYQFEEHFGFENYNTNRIELGLMYRIKAY